MLPTAMTAANAPVFSADIDAVSADLIRKVAPYTMTSMERLYALRQAVIYLARHRIAGDFVECGVWRGGSMALAAATLVEHVDTQRRLWLYDTFEGMSEPTGADVDLWGRDAKQLLQTPGQQTELVHAISPIEQSQWVMRQTNYPAERVVFVKGRVEESIPAHAPEVIALLRLDTDWYESTYHELVHLWPRLAIGGVLIVDDYGHWEGARRAVDQFVEERKLRILLNRIDYTGRMAVKLEA
ncbi:MAG TPA: TylF/MycF/NovP-related O-methyltransferase [Tepidisphaeraceae bacterium]|jgi:hypothetical protein